ncbi:MAG: hypothetical protein ACOC03_01505 [Desulfosalsimonas sp.]
MEDPPGRYVKQGTSKTGSETVSIRKNQSGFCQTLETGSVFWEIPTHGRFLKIKKNCEFYPAGRLLTPIVLKSKKIL